MGGRCPGPTDPPLLLSSSVPSVCEYLTFSIVDNLNIHVINCQIMTTVHGGNGCKQTEHLPLTVFHWLGDISVKKKKLDDNEHFSCPELVFCSKMTFGPVSSSQEVTEKLLVEALNSLE